MIRFDFFNKLGSLLLLFAAGVVGILFSFVVKIKENAFSEYSDEDDNYLFDYVLSENDPVFYDKKQKLKDDEFNND